MTKAKRAAEMSRIRKKGVKNQKRAARRSNNELSNSDPPDFMTTQNQSILPLTPAEAEKVRGSELRSGDGFGFRPSELLADYSEWTKCAQLAEPSLCPDTREWLYEWRMWDLACSPMDDDDRRRTRYGHYLGWHAALKLNHSISHHEK